MTDNEIIKALKCCGTERLKGQLTDELPCNVCPMRNCEDCEIELPDYALDLINRQKAEIERYKGVIKILENDIETAKSEAIRGFSKYLIDKAETNSVNISDLPDLVIEFMKTEDNNKCPTTRKRQ